MPGHICDLASVGKFAGTEQVQPTDGDMIGIEAAQLPMPGQLKMKQGEPQTRENIKFSVRSLKTKNFQVEWTSRLSGFAEGPSAG